MRIVALFLFAFFTFSGGVWAQPGTDGMSLSGMAQFVELRKPFYIGALYTTSGSQDAAVILSTTERKRMDIRVSGERWTPRSFSNQWTQALLINGAEERLAEFDDALIQFNNLAVNSFVRGDQIIIDSYDDGATEIFVNGVSALKVDRPGFFELLVSKWIGPRPPSSEFKVAMLSGKSDPQLAEEFEFLQPATERRRETAAWYGVELAEPPQLAETVEEVPPATAPEAEPAPEVEPTPEPESPPQAEPEVMPPVAAVPDVSSPATPEPAPVPEPEPIAAAPAPAPPLAATEMEEPQVVDPEMYRLQQQTLLRLYRSSVIKRTLANVEYPRRAQKRNQEGTVVLEVTVDRNGQVQAIVPTQETPHELLNQAAKDALAATGSFPAVPAGLDGDTVNVSIPVKFILN